MNVLHSFNLNKDPAKEILGFNRSEEAEYGKFSSFKGRCICVLLVPLHLAALPCKPTLYILKSLATLVGAVSLPIITVIQGLIIKDKKCITKALDQFTNLSSEAYKLIYIAGIAVPVQSVNIIKAIVGIFHPGAYFINSTAAIPAGNEFQSLTINNESKNSLRNPFSELSEGEDVNKPAGIADSTVITPRRINGEYIQELVNQAIFSDTSLETNDGKTTLEENFFFD